MRHKGKCNSEQSPLLRYFRLWCPCFCCCNGQNRVPACCKCCPYKDRYDEKHRKKKFSDEETSRRKSVHDKSNKKSSLKTSVGFNKKSNTKTSNKSSAKHQSKSDVKNKSKSEKGKSVIFTCPPKPEVL